MCLIVFVSHLFSVITAKYIWYYKIARLYYKKRISKMAWIHSKCSHTEQATILAKYSETPKATQCDGQRLTETVSDGTQPTFEALGKTYLYPRFSKSPKTYRYIQFTAVFSWNEHYCNHNNLYSLSYKLWLQGHNIDNKIIKAPCAIWSYNLKTHLPQYMICKQIHFDVCIT